MILLNILIISRIRSALPLKRNAKKIVKLNKENIDKNIENDENDSSFGKDNEYKPFELSKNIKNFSSKVVNFIKSKVLSENIKEENAKKILLRNNSQNVYFNINKQIFNNNKKKSINKEEKKQETKKL